MGRNAVSLAGRRFGKLVAVEIVDRNQFRNSRWLCQCDCGGVKAVLYQNLVNGMVTSCGCVKRGRKPREQQAS